MMNEKRKKFINLTNGIEALDKYNLEIDDVNFIRIQSSHFEAQKYDEVISNLDYNLLMFLALGYECEIYDYGARAETAKALRIGIEWIKFVLYKRWLKKDYTPIIKFKKVTNYFNEQYIKLSQKSKKKLDYYEKFVLTDEIKLIGINNSTEMDNKNSYYIGILHQKARFEK